MSFLSGGPNPMVIGLLTSGIGVMMNMVMMILICAGAYFVLGDEWSNKLSSDRAAHRKLEHKLDAVTRKLDALTASLAQRPQRPETAESEGTEPVSARADSVLTSGGDSGAPGGLRQRRSQQ